MIKILLTGATSVGKTTLLNDIRNKHYQNVAVLDEVAREILENNPKLETDPYLQDHLFTEQVKRETKTEQAGSKILVCDRGTLDIIAFSQLFGLDVKNKWIEWSKTYDMALLLNLKDINFQITPLQQKMEGRDWVAHRIDMNSRIEKSLIDCGIPYRHLSGTRNERLNELEIILDREIRNFEGVNFINKERK